MKTPHNPYRAEIPPKQNPFSMKAAAIVYTERNDKHRVYAPSTLSPQNIIYPARASWSGFPRSPYISPFFPFVFLKSPV